MADQKLTALTALATLSADDLFYVVDDPAGAALSRKMAASVLDGRYLQVANNLSDLANVVTARGNLGLGSAAVQNSSAFATAAQGALADSSLQLADIGVIVQAWDADLDTIAGLAKADGNFIVGDGAAWVVESGATARASLGLGTIATQNANAVTISGGSITGITDLAIADGGTGQSTAQLAIDALTAVSGATNEHVLTKDTATGNAIFKAAAGGGGSSLPVADTQTIVMGSADNTKLLRFEVDGFTAGTTRVMTPPNQDFTAAGLEVAQTFTTNQTILGNLTLQTAASIIFDGNSFIEHNTGSGDNLLLYAGGVFVLSCTSIGGTPKVGINKYQPTSMFEIVAPANRSATMLFDSYLNGGFNAEFVISRFSQDFNGAIILYTGGAPKFTFGFADNSNDFIVRDLVPATLIDRISVAEDNGNMKFQRATATTGAVLNVAILNAIVHTGTAGAGFGPGLSFQGQSSTTANQDMGRLTYEWVVETHATRTTRGKFTVYDTAEREAIRIEASGTAAMLGVLGAAAIARQAHIVDPSGGGTQDTEARTAINSILLLLENFGFAATS